MSEHYVNMRLRVPTFLHGQLLRKQRELKREAASDHFTLEDTAIMMMNEAFLWEYQHKIEGKEKVEGTNEQGDVLYPEFDALPREKQPYRVKRS